MAESGNDSTILEWKTEYTLHSQSKDLFGVRKHDGQIKF